MRKLTLAGLIAAPALVLSIGLSTAASASTTPNANAATNGKIDTSYLQAYVNGSGFHVVTFTCTGEHIDNSALVKENETCAITGDTSGLIAGSFHSNPPSPFGIFGAFGNEFWFSDFDGAVASAWQATFKDAGNGWTLRLYAQYPATG
jgi:hypothetical protein